MIRLVCIVEVAEAETVAEAQAKLDAFREAVLPNEHGLSIYRASEAVADAAYHGEPGGDDSASPCPVRSPDGYECDGIEGHELPHWIDVDLLALAEQLLRVLKTETKETTT